VKYTWDAGGNLSYREDVLASQTETFTYDFLDRLTAVSGPYSRSYAYDEIGNITTFNGTSYTYGSQPHAVTAVGQSSYTYDANGNMTNRNGQTITWDVENRPVTITDGQNTTTYVYDGDGDRVLETEGGETILYVNRCYEKNLTTSEITTYYYLGDRLIAQRKGSDLTYLHKDHLKGTSLTTDSNGDSQGTIKYYPYGGTVKSRRVVALSPSTCDVLREYRLQQETERLVSGKPLQEEDRLFPWLPNRVTHAWLKLVRKLGLHGVRFHDCRHSHASLMLKQGVHPKVVSERLGHSSIVVTLDVYSHVAPGIQEAAAQAFDDLVPREQKISTR
jgi:YD repeat-containing protein